MMPKTKKEFRTRRHFRVRHKVTGTPVRPRLTVFVSSKHIYAQVIDDEAGRTLASASTMIADLKGAKPNVETARKVGTLAAQKAIAQGIQKVVFDRGGFTYSGKVKALADAAREAGLQF
jgi:large subunit ribosomal protein L18